jgi:hypothetical protein
MFSNENADEKSIINFSIEKGSKKPKKQKVNFYSKEFVSAPFEMCDVGNNCSSGNASS